MTATEEIVLDTIDLVKVDHNKYSNEIGTLHTLSNGLRELCALIKRRELAFEKASGGKFKILTFGGTSPEERYSLDVTACMFHWFGLPLCNYVRLIGYIRGLDRGDFTRADLTDKKAVEKVKKSIEGYVSSVTEIAAVKVWRNKVFAHFAITDPYKDDNMSTLEISVVFPVTFEGRYVVGSMVITKKNSSGSHTSALPRWSMTEVFEALIPRFWPGTEFKVEAPESTKEESDV